MPSSRDIEILRQFAELLEDDGGLEPPRDRIDASRERDGPGDHVTNSSVRYIAVAAWGIRWRGLAPNRFHRVGTTLQYNE